MSVRHNWGSLELESVAEDLVIVGVVQQFLLYLLRILYHLGPWLQHCDTVLL